MVSCKYLFVFLGLGLLCMFGDYFSEPLGCFELCLLDLGHLDV